MKLYAYLRVSSKQQVEQGGLDRQEESARAFAESGGHEIVEVFMEEGISGVTLVDDRPAFVRMMSGMDAGGVKNVVVERLDRLAREYVVQEQIIVYLASRGFNIWVATTGENITEAVSSDPMKKAMIQMQGIFAELDKALILKRMEAGRQKKLKETGKCGGRLNWDEVYPERKAELITVVRQLRRKPKGCSRRMSFTKIAAELNRLGLKSFTGKPWNENMANGFYRNYCLKGEL